MTAAEALAVLRSHANAANVAGMARYGISSEGTLGVPVPIIRALAKQAGKDHRLAAGALGVGYSRGADPGHPGRRTRSHRAPPNEPLGA